MALTRVVSSTLRSSASRITVLRSRASLTGSGPLFFTAIAHRCPPQQLRRIFVSTAASSRASHTSDDAADLENLSTEELLDELEEGKIAEQESDEDNAVPWYLEGEEAPISSNPVAERQQLPDLPEHPPPLLQEFLEHISVDLGLDDLTLLDLRHLDPPPALGSNLLMIIGTARSEKHLHVSADRFCRWLRSNYKLRPHAAGLLGRNELKIKLRRRAKRLKLLATAGAHETHALDDGIRTGWICVNIGKVAPAPDAPKRALPRPEGFVGFGGDSEDVTLVVQMFTEENRLEIDLEGLWGKAAKRAGQEPETVEEEQAAVDDQKRLDDISMGRIPATYPSQQVRGIHTLTGSRLAGSSPYSLGLPQIKSTLSPLTTTGHKELANAYSQKPSLGNDESISGSSEEARLRADSMARLLAELKTMDRDTAIEALGIGYGDDESTPFLRAFYEHVSLYSERELREAEVSLVCHAWEIRHPGYSLGHIREALQNVQTDCPPVSESILKEAFKSSLRDIHTTTEYPTAMEQALSILELMHFSGYNVLQADIVASLYTAATPTDPDPTDPSSSNLHELAAFRRSILLEYLDKHLISPSQPTWLTLLHAAARGNDTDALWALWSAMARRLYPRSEDLYVAFLNHIAEVAERSPGAAARESCARALRVCIPEMNNEALPVTFDADLARAVLAVLRQLHPLVGLERPLQVPEEAELESALTDPRWFVWRQKCMRALGLEDRASSAMIGGDPVAK